MSGFGFGRSPGLGAPGIPVTTTMGIDGAGVLYLAKSGSRYVGDSYDLLPIYRIPPGGARLTTASEARYFYGPPLRNPALGMVSAEGELFVTTYDPDRRIGVLYRMQDRRPVLFAGGTPLRGTSALLHQPEGVALDAAGHVYVADRLQDRVLKLDPRGRVVNPVYLRVQRPRTLALDARGRLWVGTDGSAERPWQDGIGEIWRVDQAGEATRMLVGPHPAAVSLGPGGLLFVAQRDTGTIFVLRPDGQRAEFARFTGDRAPRTLAFVPDTPGTRDAGIGGDLLVVTLSPRTWYVNEVIRISGPFEGFAAALGAR